MTRRLNIFALAAAIFAAAVVAIVFLRASSTYAGLRDSDAAWDQITVASSRANLWFIILMIAIGLATSLFAVLVVRRK